jgi:hypothetical protein
MELQKSNNTPMTLSKVSQSALSLAIRARKFDEASRLMPTRIEQVFDQPKVNELILAIGATEVKNQVEYEVTVLASLVNTGGNLSNAQVTFIAEQLIQKFPTESIADFKICFQRGLTGNYGQIFRMDSIVLFDWMEKYLDEKYQVMEDKLMKEKENHYKIPTNVVERDYTEILDSISKIETKPMREMTDQEIKEEGQERSKRPMYIQDDEYAKYRALHLQYVRENYDPYTGDKLPTWISEEQWMKLNQK